MRANRMVMSPVPTSGSELGTIDASAQVVPPSVDT